MTDEEFQAAKKASGPIVITTIHGRGKTTKKVYHECEQCGALMNPVDWMVGHTCLKCCRENRRRVMGL